MTSTRNIAAKAGDNHAELHQQSFNSEDSFSLSNFKVSYLERNVPVLLTALLVISAVLVGVSVFALYLALLHYGFINFKDALEVRTSCGYIRGIREDKIIKYLGIPYALPPINENRFSKPVELSTELLCNQAWEPFLSTSSKVLLATEYRSVCSQIVPISNQVSGNEDCLYLNIFLPHSSNNAELKPVIVILGGLFFMFGGASNGSFFETEPHPDTILDVDAVHVTFNYRLGPFGFLTHPLTNETNIGIRDQIAALRWIKSNIQAFGGDPARITIFAYGSGATTTLGLLSSPPAQNLFDKAWISAPAVGAPSTTFEAAVVTSSSLLKCSSGKDTECNFLQSTEGIIQMWNWSVIEPWIRHSFFGLPSASTLACLPGVPCNGGILIIDDDIVLGKNWGKPIYPTPIVFGQTSNEVAVYITPSTVRFWDNNTLKAYLKSNFEDSANLFQIIDKFYNEKRIMLKVGTSEEQSITLSKTEDALTRIVTDIRVTCPMQKFISNMKSHQQIYRYYFKNQHIYFDPFGLECFIASSFHGWDALSYLRTYLTHVDYLHSASIFQNSIYLSQVEELSSLMCKFMKQFAWGTKISPWRTNTFVNVLNDGRLSSVSSKDLSMCHDWNDALSNDIFKYAWNA